MSQQVAVVGVYQTPYKEKYDNIMLEELIYQSVKGLLQQSGITMADIDNSVIASSDMTDGRAISSMVTGGAAGAYHKDLLNLSSNGEHAFLLGTMQIMSGMYDLTLVVSWSKTSESPMTDVERLSCEPYYTRGIGLNHVISSSLEASAYQSKFNPNRDLISAIALKNRKNAMKNPLAHLQSEISLQEVRNSPVISWPLKKEEIPPLSDGVCAILLASEKKAKEFSGPKAWIKGLGWATDGYWLGERDLTRISSLENAARQAYHMAGVTKPLEQIDLAELQESSSYNEAIQYESLGFCKPGESARLIEQGTFSRDGSLPVNLSGGALSSNPMFCSGLIRIAETALQVMGKAGPHQAPNIRTGLATCVSGFASQSSTVVILSA